VDHLVDGVGTAVWTPRTEKIRSVFERTRNCITKYRDDFRNDDGSRAAELVDLANKIAKDADKLPIDGSGEAKVYRWFTVSRAHTLAALAEDLLARKGTDASNSRRNYALEQRQAACSTALQANEKAMTLLDSNPWPGFEEMMIPEISLYDRVLCLTINAMSAPDGEQVKAFDDARYAYNKHERDYTEWHEQSKLKDEPLVRLLLSRSRMDDGNQNNLSRP